MDWCNSWLIWRIGTSTSIISVTATNKPTNHLRPDWYFRLSTELYCEMLKWLYSGVHRPFYIKNNDRKLKRSCIFKVHKNWLLIVTRLAKDHKSSFCQSWFGFSIHIRKFPTSYGLGLVQKKTKTQDKTFNHKEQLPIFDNTSECLHEDSSCPPNGHKIFWWVIFC